MLESAIWALAAGVTVLLAGLYAALASFLALLRAEPALEGAPILPMSLIKPIKGLDDDLASNLDSIVRSDRDGVLQVLVALESESDPAYGTAEAFRRRHPGRDIEVLLTGSPRGRMGKTHNMIAAMGRAKHERVVFSDADIETTPRLIAETSLAFARGAQAVFALPRHRRVPGLGGLLFEAAMNHSFDLWAALSWRFGLLKVAAGAWMGFTKEALEAAGGLEPVDHAIADDFALSSRVCATGARAVLLPVLVPLKETGTGLKETVRHLAKWAAIMRWTVPRLYLIAPVMNLGVLALALWALCESSGRHEVLGRGLAAAAFLSRGFVALYQDAAVSRELAPAWWYAAMSFCDLGSLWFWVSGFRREIVWRGVRYRLSSGGRAEIVDTPTQKT